MESKTLTPQSGGERTETGIVKAPWTDEQVDLLERRQNLDTLHEYTCGPCGSQLIPTNRGWECEDCHSHDQHWCHASDLDPQFIALMEQREKDIFAMFDAMDALNGSTNPKRSSSTASGVSNPNE